MNAVMYMNSAMRRIADMDRQTIGLIVLEVARLRVSVLQINEPEVRYGLEYLEGDFSGLVLLCLLHVGFQQLQPRGDCGSGLDQEHELALEMAGGAGASLCPC